MMPFDSRAREVPQAPHDSEGLVLRLCRYHWLTHLQEKMNFHIRMSVFTVASDGAFSGLADPDRSDQSSRERVCSMLCPAPSYARSVLGPAAHGSSQQDGQGPL